MAAFVALAAIGLFAMNFHPEPQYSAVLDVPGITVAQQDAQGAQDPQDGADGSQGEGSGEGADEATTASDGSQGEGADGSVLEADADGEAQVEAAPASFDASAIPFSKEVAAFSADGGTPAIAEAALEPVNAAYAQLADNGVDAGFVFMNLESGSGIAANADQKVYGASSIKGPFAVYVCEELIDGGTATTETTIKSYNDNFASNGSASLKSLITNSVVNSSNGAFSSLKRAYDDGYDQWLKSVGVDPGIFERSDDFAWFTARDAAKMWGEAYSYLASGTETAEWLGGLMGDTSVSYIRDGATSLKTQLKEQEWAMPATQASAARLIKATADSVSGYRNKTAVLDDVTVLNKAGWCVSDAGSKVDYDSTSDNGIVTIDGTDYLLCIMTGAPDSAWSAEKVTNLAAAVISVYDELV